MAEPDARSTAEALTAAVSPSLRSFLLIDSAAMSVALTGRVAESLAEATRLIALVLRPDRTCNLVFGKPPFRLNLGNGELTFVPSDHVVQAHVTNIICIDVQRLLGYELPYRVAMLLEELIHVLMSVEDEAFVMKVVADLYPGIAVVDGQYVTAEA